MTRTIPLGGGWQLKGTDPYVPLRENSMETGKPLEGVTGWMDADVPGGVALALYRAGYIEDPYVGMNSLRCEWIENRWWIYRKAFDRPAVRAKRMLLRFLGVDYACRVYLNGQCLGTHEGMFESFAFDITPIWEAAETLVLEVLILHAPDEMGQIGRTSLTTTQKSRFGYKWDFGTRLVNLGIWRDVELVAEDSAVLDDLSITTDVAADGTGLVHVSGAVRANEAVGPATVAVDCRPPFGRPDERPVTQCLAPVENGRFAATLRLAQPALWYPNGLGAQPLYDVTLTLAAGAPLDTRRFAVGIRRVEYLPNEGAPADALPYTLAINGEKMYIKGVNLTPMDHIYGDIPREMVEYALCRAAQMHANLVRVWGGGLIESEWFYDCCDRLGLLVWQEFIQSSSGIDNIPAQAPAFLALLEGAARCALREKRNHTALVLWSGGNELMEADRRPVTLSNPNIALLAGLVRELDPTRQFLPTSASGPSEFISPRPGESHDVHGWWQYQGNPAHYRFYAGSDSLLHSEFGCDGMSCMATVRKILPTPPQAPVRMRDDDCWRFHGDWWCTYDRELSMFGPVDALDRYIPLSQWMQAEGLRFILEANRRRAFRNSGSIIWQLNEPWPNLSCTALMDYFGHLKMAYFWAKKAFAPFHIALAYDRLDHRPGERFEGSLSLFADSTVPSGRARVCVSVLDLFGKCLHTQARDVCLDGSQACDAGPLSFPAPDVSGGLFLVRLTAATGGFAADNTYYFSGAGDRPYQAAAALRGGQLAARTLETDGTGALLELTNTGTVAVLHIAVRDALDEWSLTLDDSFRTLLPGERWRVRVTWRKRFRFGFDAYAALPSRAPRLQVQGIGMDGPLTV